MKKIRSYTGIWNVEKVLYALQDLKLPFPITYSQLAWLMSTFCLVLMFQNVPPLSMIESGLLKYVGVPVGVMWFMSKKTFDGKKPYSFLKSFFMYQFRPKLTFGGKAVQMKKKKKAVNYSFTAVRSVLYDPESEISN